MRIRLSNRYGDVPLRIAAAHVALRDTGTTIHASTDRALRFAGNPGVAIPPGEERTSDPVALDIPALKDIAVSLAFVDSARATTNHLLALQTSYVSADASDQTGSPALPGAKTFRTWPFLVGIDVLGVAGDGAIVAFGDSMNDGDGTRADLNQRWTDVLATALQATERGRRISVVSAGIIGNRILAASPPGTSFGNLFGESGLARYERDALSIPGVRYIVVRAGANDLGYPGALDSAAAPVRAESVIDGLRTLARAAHARGLRVLCTTITPFEGATIAPGYFTPEKDAERVKVNEWLRSQREFDAVVDADALLRDPLHPARLNPAFDAGDHIHANPAGHAAVANAMPLDVFGVAMPQLQGSGQSATTARPQCAGLPQQPANICVSQVAATSALLPARRAARVDPLIALRTDS